MSSRPPQIDVPGLEQPPELTAGKLARGNATIGRNQGVEGKIVCVRYLGHEGINAFLAVAGQEDLNIEGLRQLVDEFRETTDQPRMNGVLELVDQDHPIGRRCEQKRDKENPLQSFTVIRQIERGGKIIVVHQESLAFVDQANIVEGRQYFLPDKLEDFW